MTQKFSKKCLWFLKIINWQRYLILESLKILMLITFFIQNFFRILFQVNAKLLNCIKVFSKFFRSSHYSKKKKKKGVVMWDLEGRISWGYLAHCSHPFFMSLCIEFLASYSMLSSSFVTLASLAGLFINPEFCQCPLRRSCQLQLFWYLQQTACFCCISL